MRPCTPPLLFLPAFTLTRGLSASSDQLGGAGFYTEPAITATCLPDPNNLPFSNDVMTASRTKSRRSWRGTCIVHWSTSGCRSAAALSAIRSMPGAGRRHRCPGHNTDCCSQARAITDPPTCSSPAATVTCASISFDAPLLKGLTIGIQIGGDDYNNPLASRHIVENVRGFMIYGDYSRPDPQREIVDAVADGRVDVAVVWGPLAGYYAKRESMPIDVRPVAASVNGSPSRFTFDIAMGVRRDDTTLRGARQYHHATR